ncbi:MAG: histidine phosphatase family protein [Armatimonadota bacterium]
MSILLYIVRHGQTVDNLQGRIQGHTDSPLTELGIRQAKAAAHRLSRERLDCIYSSDLNRALSTAQIIAQSQRSECPIIPDSRLRELNLGVAQGLTREQYAELRPEEYALWRQDSIKNRPQGAERIEQAIDRCADFLDYIAKHYQNEANLGIVAHGGSIKSLLLSALQLPIHCYRRLATANAGLTILELSTQPLLRLFNDTCHLREVTELDVDTG